MMHLHLTLLHKTPYYAHQVESPDLISRLSRILLLTVKSEQKEQIEGVRYQSAVVSTIVR